MQEVVKHKSLSIVIPAYNEERRIEKVLKSYIDFMDPIYGESYEIIIVCNGCIDDTPEIVREISNRHHKVKPLYFKEKLGKGGAIIEGLKMAKGDFIGFVDADESTSADEYNKMIDMLNDSRIDGVIGSRKIEGSTILVKQPLKRRIASKAFNILVQLMFGLHFKDTQCGAKVFKKEAIASVIEELQSKGFEFDVELLWRLERKGYLIREAPIVWKHDPGSTFNLKQAPTMFMGLLRVRLLK